MNLAFRKTSLAKAVNDEGAYVRSVGRELMEYGRGEYNVAIEVFFRDGKATAYEPTLSKPYPNNMSADELKQEIRAGVETNSECPVEWRAQG